MDLFRSLLPQLVAFRTVSADPEQHNELSRAAQFLKNLLLEWGFASEVFEEGSAGPFVFGKRIFNDDYPTVLIYGHYDVQPPEPLASWAADPFLVREDGGYFFGRGVADDKGPFLVALVALHQAIQRSTVRFNVKILLEGGEEIGSPTFSSFLKKNRSKLEADFALMVDTGCPSEEVAEITTGTRGLLAFEIRLKTAERDIHSGFGGALANAATLLCRLCATLHNENNRVQVEGFYEGIHSPSEQEMLAFREEDDSADDAGVRGFFQPVPGYNSHMTAAFFPSLEINGLGGGYQGEGSKTILPCEAFAKITARIVGGQDPQRIRQAVIDHLQRYCSPLATLEILASEPESRPYVLDGQRLSPIFKNAFRQLESVLTEAFGRPPQQRREGGTIGVLGTIKEVLGLDTLMVGLVPPSAKIHAPNENWSCRLVEKSLVALENFFSQD